MNRARFAGVTRRRLTQPLLRAAIALLDRSGFGPGVRLQHSEDDQGLREIRVCIIEPSPEQLAADEDSDREVAAARQAERQANAFEPKPKRLTPYKDNSVSFNLELDQ